MDIELPFDFKEFLKLLNEKGVRYLLIGGYAVGYTVIHARQMIWMFGLPFIRTTRSGLSRH